MPGLQTADGSTAPDDIARVSERLRAGASFLPDEVYTQVLANVVVNCVDVIVEGTDGKILMGRRVNRPWADHWHPPGGRQKPGEDYGQAGARHLKRDLGLIVDPTFLWFLTTNNFMWNDSAQGVPCHMNGILMQTTLTQSEYASIITRDKGDFAEVRWFEVDEITNDRGFHPAIVEGVKRYRSGQWEYVARS